MRTLVLSLFLTPGLASAQTLTLGGSCPGVVEITMDGTTPGGSLVLLAGSGEGAARVPGGPCADIDSGLSGPLRWFGPFRDSDGDGALTLRPTLRGAACESTFAFVDLATCEASSSDAFGVSPPVGNVIFAAQGRAGRSFLGPWHLYGIDLDSGAVTDVGDLGTGLTGLSVGPDGAMWAVQAEGRDYPDYYTVDTTTAALRLESVSSDLGSMSGFSWWRGELLAWSESGDILGTVDPATGVWTSTGISNSTGGHCMATNAAGELYRLDRAELFLTSTDGTDVKLGDVSGLGSWQGHGCTFHDGQLYTHDSTWQLFTVDLVSLVATPTGIFVPEHTDALGSYTP